MIVQINNSTPNVYMKFEFELKKYFGKKTYYPINDNARTICMLLKRKTVSSNIILQMRAACWHVDIFDPESIL